MNSSDDGKSVTLFTLLLSSQFLHTMRAVQYHSQLTLNYYVCGISYKLTTHVIFTYEELGLTFARAIFADFTLSLVTALYTFCVRVRTLIS